VFRPPRVAAQLPRGHRITTHPRRQRHLPHIAGLGDTFTAHTGRRTFATAPNSHSRLMAAFRRIWVLPLEELFAVACDVAAIIHPG